MTYADGATRDVMKSPKTDSGKFSLPGKLQVFRVKGAPTAYPSPASWEDTLVQQNLLRVVYDHGPVDDRVWDDFDTVRERVEKEWPALPPKGNPISRQLRAKIEKIIAER